MAVLEIACFDAASAIVASSTGADRIGLCADRAAGGTTPSVDSTKFVKRSVTLPVFVMIRPRRGNFLYSDAEFEQMNARIVAFKPLVDGFVLGILNKEQRVDVIRTAALVQRAHPLPCTFHRAFDKTPDKLEALEDVIATGCTTILTSGGASDICSGAKMIAELVQAAGNRIEVMPGGGLRSGNIAVLRDVSIASTFHSSALVDGSTEPVPEEIQTMKRLLSDC